MARLEHATAASWLAILTAIVILVPTAMAQEPGAYVSRDAQSLKVQKEAHMDAADVGIHHFYPWRPCGMCRDFRALPMYRRLRMCPDSSLSLEVLGDANPAAESQQRSSLGQCFDISEHAGGHVDIALPAWSSNVEYTDSSK